MIPPPDVELLRYSPSKIKIITHEGKKTAQLLCFNQIKRKDSREEEKEEEKEELQTSPGPSDCEGVPRIPLIHSVPDLNELKVLSNIPFKNVKEDSHFWKPKKNILPDVHGFEQHNYILPPNKSKCLNKALSLRKVLTTSTCPASTSEVELKIENNICRAELEGLKTSWHKIVEENMRLRQRILEDEDLKKTKVEQPLDDKEGTILKLEENITRLKEENISYAKRIDSLKMTLNQTTSENRDILVQNKVLKDEILNLEIEKGETYKKIRLKEETIEERMVELAQSYEQIKIINLKLSDTITENDLKNKDQEERLKTLIKKSEEVEPAKKELNLRNSFLEERVQEFSNKNDELNERIKRIETDKVNKNNAMMQTDPTVELTSSLCKDNEEKLVLDKVIIDLKNAHQKLYLENNLREKEILELKSTNASLGDELETCRKCLVDSNNKLELEIDEKENLKRMSNEIVEKERKYLSKVESFQIDLNEKEKSITDLKCNLSNVKDNYEKVIEELSHTKSVEISLRMENEEMRSSIDHHRDMAEKLEIKLRDQKQQLDLEKLKTNNSNKETSRVQKLFEDQQSENTQMEKEKFIHENQMKQLLLALKTSLNHIKSLRIIIEETNFLLPGAFDEVSLSNLLNPTSSIDRPSLGSLSLSLNGLSQDMRALNSELSDSFSDSECATPSFLVEYNSVQEEEGDTMTPSFLVKYEPEDQKSILETPSLQITEVSFNNGRDPMHTMF